MSEAPLGRRATMELLAAHGVVPHKRYGQHFLVDPNVTRKIVATAGVAPGDRVLEIGAGAGTLTRALATAGAEVVAFEIDERLRPVLATTLAGCGTVDVRFEDAATADLPALVADGGWLCVANLPYNVGTPIVLDLLRHGPGVRRFVVMLQREAIERFAAPPGSKAYGVPSVVVAIHGSVRIAMRVPPDVFFPPPRVESAVAVIDRMPAPDTAEAAIGLAAAGFGQRRKMLRRSLAGRIGDVEATLTAAGLDPTDRAEDVAPDGWVRLAEVIDAS